MDNCTIKRPAGVDRDLNCGTKLVRWSCV